MQQQQQQSAGASNGGGAGATTTSAKMERTKPFNLFLNSTPSIVGPNTLSFKDMLCPSLGNIKSTLHINFLVDLLWLYEQYQAAGCAKKPMTVLYGFEVDYREEETIDCLNKIMPNVKHFLIETQDIFGINHSRLAIFEYTDGSIRIAVPSANLKEIDWNQMNQTVWLSAACPPMPAHVRDVECGGPTGFKKALVAYLKKYRMPAALTDWINLVRRADFSSVNVLLVTSVPGPHYSKSLGCHVLDMAYYLKKHCSMSEDANAWSIIAGVSSLGSYGDNASAWLTSLFLRSLGRHRDSTGESSCDATLNVIYPTLNNMRNMELEMPMSNVQKDYQQEWLKMFLHQWSAKSLNRTTLVPYAKSYCRISPCFTKLAWYLTTSANLAKSDWGVKWDSDVYVRSWELGVLFIPKFFDMEFFSVQTSDEDAIGKFPLLFDLPLVPYDTEDIAY